MKQSKPQFKHGFTLIELLLYLTIAGTLLLVLSVVLQTVLESRVKNQVIAEVDQQGAAIMQTITQVARNAETINSPATGASGSSLVITEKNKNLLTGDSADFEAGTGSWTVNGGAATLSSSTDQANTLTHSLKAAVTSSTNLGLYSPQKAAVAGDNYNYKYYMRSSVARTFQGYLLFYNSGGTLLQAFASSGTVSSTSAWKTEDISGKAPANTAFVAGAVLIYTPANGESHYIDTAAVGPATNFSLSSSKINMTQDVGLNADLNSSRVTASGLTFTNLTRTGTPGALRIQFTLTHVNTSGRNEFNYSKSFYGTGSLRWP